MRKKRLDLGLLQRQVALLLGTTECSVMYWETNRTTPTLTYLPAIVKFLGYCPLNPDDSPGRRLVWARCCNGVSQSALARAVDIDPGTLCRVEQGRWRKRGRYLDRVRNFLKAKADENVQEWRQGAPEGSVGRTPP
jgi:transcriptional regulator with XRE-family HTH domain